MACSFRSLILCLYFIDTLLEVRRTASALEYAALKPVASVPNRILMGTFRSCWLRRSHVTGWCMQSVDPCCTHCRFHDYVSSIDGRQEAIDGSSDVGSVLPTKRPLPSQEFYVQVDFGVCRQLPVRVAFDAVIVVGGHVVRVQRTLPVLRLVPQQVSVLVHMCEKNRLKRIYSDHFIVIEFASAVSR